MQILYRLLLSYLLFSSIITHSQISDFQLNVSGTNETCLGNGTIQIAATNTATLASISFVTYKLPDLNIPIATLQNISGLSNGTYRIFATQTLGNISNVKEKDFIIQNQIQDLTFSLSSPTPDNCTDTASIIVQVLTGTASGFEIISGPQTYPRQTSNVFAGLSAGTYRVRAFDICGQGFIQDIRVRIYNTRINFNSFSQDIIHSSCDATKIFVSFSVSLQSFAYPFTVSYSTQQPNNNYSIVSVQNITTNINGNPFITLTNTINFTQNTPFNCVISITDGCGKVYSSTNTIYPNIFVRLGTENVKCGNKKITILARNFVAPYNIEVLNAPADFTITNLGPYTSNFNRVGNDISGVPAGAYRVKITDVCGRTAISNLLNVSQNSQMPIIRIIPIPACDSSIGSIQIGFLNEIKIISATITQAPTTYIPSIPHDITSFISTAGKLNLNNIPSGTYSFTIIDNCGITQNINTVIVEAYIQKGFTRSVLQSCLSNVSTVQISSGDGILINMSMIAAPPSFLQPLPFNVTSKIESGVLRLADLPAGIYKFTGTDSCGYSSSITVTIVGVDWEASVVNLIKDCTSFSLFYKSVGNNNYWLQKLNESTQKWEHPLTGTVFSEGTTPTISTGIALDDNFTNSVSGIYRILYTFEVFNDGNSTQQSTLCIKNLGEFKYFDDLKIDGVFKINCSGNNTTTDAYIDAIGVPQYNYRIKSKNGDTSFNIDNGNNSVFFGLSAGTYTFEVEDQCGRLKTGTIATGTLPNLVNAFQADGVISCLTPPENIGTFDLTTQKTKILGPQTQSNYLVTYHLTAADALIGANQITSPSLFINNANLTTIFVRVVHRYISNCFATTSFPMITGQTPVTSSDSSVFICENQPVNLTADSGFDAYEWSNGETTQSITVNDAGIYSVIMKNKFFGLFCNSNPKKITVIKSGIAKLLDLKTQDWSENNNSLSISVTGIGNYEFSLDNITFQPTGNFSGLRSGFYTIYVKDQNGCETLKVATYFLNYPKFFTPNNDGYNDHWQIQFSNLEPKSIIRIYDRFDKFIYQIDNNNKGWDGTFEGNLLAADDYWFVFERQQGTIFKGHFSLKR